MNLNTNHPVCMNNDLVRSKSTLTLNETKLLRLAVMQVVREDKDFKTYRVRITDLAKALEIDSSNLYKEVQDMCVHLLQQVVLIGDGNPKHKWKAFQWCSDCEYEDGTGELTIRLHDKLNPYLIELNKCYLTYGADNVMFMKSVHAIRVYELIKMEMRTQEVLPTEGKEVILSVEDIKKSTDTENKYERFSQFKSKVIDIAVREINQKAQFNLSYEYIKKGKTVVGFRFLIKSKFADAPLSIEAQAKIEAFKERQRQREQGQMDIADYK